MRAEAKLDRRSRDNARVTISDLSQALSLTKGTVSRALNGYPDISETTRMRVIRAAQAMGYHPLSHAQAIRTGRSQALGLVIQLSEHDAHRPFLAEFLAGLTQSASIEGWSLTVSTADNDEGTLRVMRDLVQNQKADGFILPRVLLDDPRVTLLQRENIPFICYGRPKNLNNISYFDADGEMAMAGAVAHLAGLGHRRIAYIGGADQHAFSHHRTRGYLSGMHHMGLRYDQALHIEGALSPQQGAMAARQFLALPQPPTAILCATDTLARGVYEVANGLDLSIGSDLSVIGYDGSPEAAVMWPRLATYCVDNRKVGAALGAMLIDRIRDATAPASQKLIDPEFRAGASTGRPELSPDQLACKLALNTRQSHIR
nr:LacI family DNA-binding transcriptional regulator [uncultured Celeribacter sp.]